MGGGNGSLGFSWTIKTLDLFAPIPQVSNPWSSNVALSKKSNRFQNSAGTKNKSTGAGRRKSSLLPVIVSCIYPSRLDGYGLLHRVDSHIWNAAAGFTDANPLATKETPICRGRR